MALRASIGQYYSANSAIHRLDPRAKLVATVAFMASCFFVHSLAGLAIAGVAVGSCVALANVPAGRLLSQIKPIALFLFITSFINLFFVQTGQELVGFGPIRI